jgi:hypothetical protein
MTLPSPRFLAAMLAALPAAALAICPRPEPKVCSEYFASDQVFVGRVTRVERLASDPRPGHHHDGTGWLRYTVRVERHIKGRVGSVERLLSEDASARWGAEVGHRRLVFARGGEVHATCGPLDDPAHLPRALADIRALARDRTATIEGEVVTSTAQGLHHVAGHRIVVHGATGRLESVTDSAGRFRIAVPPGRYAFDPALPTAGPFESRDSAGAFFLQRGECAQFRLLSTTAPPTR